MALNPHGRQRGWIRSCDLNRCTIWQRFGSSGQYRTATREPCSEARAIQMFYMTKVDNDATAKRKEGPHQSG